MLLQETSQEEKDAPAPDPKHSNSDLLGLVKWAYRTHEKHYFRSDTLFIKRNFEESECFVFECGTRYVPYMCLERMRNEVAAIRFVQKNTNIPTPNIRCAFEDNGRFYLITDIVPGVTLKDLPDDKKAGPTKEVERYMAQMHAIKSNIMGGISGDNVLSYRITNTILDPACRDAKFANLKFRDSPNAEFVLCHNDLAQHNVIVDEKTLRVKAILDWEYAGFYPPEFDGNFYLRPGPSVAHEGEEEDVPKLLDVLERWTLPQHGENDDFGDQAAVIKESEARARARAPDSDQSNSNPLGLVKHLASTAEKKYYLSDKIFIKRNLDESEYCITPSGYKIVPYMCMERIRNEVAAIRYIQKNTNIPTANIRCTFEDNGRFYLITDIVPGVTVDKLPVEKRAGPIKEIAEYMAQMHKVKSKVMGGVGGDNALPYRISGKNPFAETRDPEFAHLKFHDAPTPEFVFCHNDLAQHNVIVDEKILRVRAILDWEYAGFYPAEFDGKFYLRPGPSDAHEGEEDDVPKLLELLEHWKV